jgi:hypothetical protein
MRNGRVVLDEEGFRLEWLPVTGDPEPFGRIAEWSEGDGVTLQVGERTWTVLRGKHAWDFTVVDGSDGSAVAGITRKGLKRRVELWSDDEEYRLVRHDRGRYGLDEEGQERWTATRAQGGETLWLFQGEGVADTWSLPAFLWIAAHVDAEPNDMGAWASEIFIPDI